jgi:cytosine/adenosine deaminase-related metal-dependent hydrolase
MLSQAKQKLCGAATLVLADCHSLPLSQASADLILCSFLTSYLRDLSAFARQAREILKPGGSIFVGDLHPETSRVLGWRRGFRVNGSLVDIATNWRSTKEILSSFEAFGMEAVAHVELPFGDAEFDLMRRAGKTNAFNAAKGHPAIYILQLRVKPSLHLSRRKMAPSRALARLVGATIALGPKESTEADIRIEDGLLKSLDFRDEQFSCRSPRGKRSVDLAGFLLLPGLVNAHDHLEFALFPRLGKGGYQNFVEWADDIHHPERSPVYEHRSVAKNTRLWWGGIRNLLCGVTTVCHHNPYVDQVFDDGFVVRVLRDFAWAHSVPLDKDLVQKQKCAAPHQPFIFHLSEGVDSRSADEVFRLADENALDGRTVVVHGLGLDERGRSLLRSVGAALIWCPTSNVFLFGRTHDCKTLQSLPRVALGSDSPITAEGDLLDEIRFAAETVALPVEQLYRLVTTGAAEVLRLRSGEGAPRVGSRADFFGIRDNGQSPAQRLAKLSYLDVEFVVIGGQVQLASTDVLARLPRLVKTGLRPLEIEGQVRWIRAPLKRLFAETRNHFPGDIKLGGRSVRFGLRA